MGQMLPPPLPRRSRELLGGFYRKKRHSTRRDVNFLNVSKNLVFDQGRGGWKAKTEKIWVFCNCHRIHVSLTDFDGKGCFVHLKYRSLTYRVMDS